MATTTRAFDPAAYLEDDAAMAVYMSEALETGDPAFIADALGVIARARGRRRSLRTPACRARASTAP